MKFNLFLLAVFTSLASAIPFSYKENGKARFGCNKYDIDCKAAQSKVGRLNSKIPISNKKNGNQYFGCNKFDIGCKIKQSKLCYNEVYNCYNNKYKKYMDCVKLANYCNDIWFNNNNYYKPTPSQITTQIPTQVTTQITTEIPTEIPTNQEPQPAQPNEPITNSFKPTKENVKIIGRAKYIDDSLWVCNVDSGIEFKINGKSATIVVSTDSIYGSLGADTPARLLVYGDGKVVLDVLTQEETSELNVEFDEAGEHTVHLMKTTECQHGSIYINEIKTDSEVITPTPAKSKKIEFVGDSITAAVGALTKECEYFSTQSDGSYSYALKVAQKLDADYSIYAYGGFGVYGEPRKGHEYLIPPLYEKLGYLNWNADHPENTTLPMNTVDWDGSEFEPDLIFVNVGTNDAFYIRGISKDQQEEEQINFSNAYKDFIAQIRSVHPNAEILCTLGMMGQFLYEEIENAVDAYVKETKDDKVRAFPLSEENLELNGPGFSGHPSIFSHVFAANEAIEKIEELYGWKSDPNVDISEKVNSNPQPQPQPSQPNEPITNSFKPTKENVKIIGRAKYIDDSLWVCNVDSGIEFKINGKSATIVVSTDSIYGSLGADTPARLLVYGDDKVVLDVLTQEETSELNVEFDEAGEHTVHLMKTTECQHGSIYINEIKTDSEVITPTPAKSKKIEFVGDSITAAVGALTKECEYFSTQSDGSYSYALKVAQKLDADYSIYAYGGFGVYGEPRKGHEYLIPPLYEKLGYLNWNADHPENTTLPMNTVDWDGSEFEPDLIFVNVGTNDAFYIRGISKDQQEEEQINFSNAYKDFIAQIRSVHPNAEILCTLGMMGQFLYEEIENAVDAYVKETKDDKVRAFPLSEENLELNGPGFSGHPSIFSHVFAANEAIEKIEELYGWKSDPNVDISEKVNSNPQPQPQPSQPNEPVTNSFKPTKENVKIIGRAKYIDDSLWVCNVDSGIEFKINGKSATIVVSTDSIYGSLGADTPARLLVYGDDKVVLDVLTQEETSELNVEFDEAGEHTVHLMKTTECQHGSIYINEIKTDSEVITPTPAKSKKIEFVGDSITAAVGALTKECEYFSTQSDGSYSYALKVAQKLDADYSIYAYGGFGVYGEPRKGHEYLIPPLYEKLGYLNWNADHPENTTLPMNTVDWDGSEFEPDLIFVNVGTNDAFYIRGISKDQQEEEQINFSNAYKDFIAQIRSVHPNAEILCTLGMMGQFLYEEIENAVDAYVKETKDDKVRAFPLSEENLELNGPGFSGHPSIFSHVFAANEAIEKIEELYGWKSDPNVDISEKVNSNPQPQTQPSQPNEPVTNSFKPTKENVKIIGRAKYIDDSLWVCNVDSGIEFKINGKSATIVVSTDSIYGSLGADTPARLLVYGDGKVVLDVLTQEETSELNVEFDEAGEHTVHLMKTTECQHGSIYINEIKTDSEVITPTPAKSKKIEFVGDSITAAVGALTKECEYFSTQSDGSYSYALKVAQKLDADYSIYAYGGFGVYGEPRKGHEYLIPPLYEKLGYLNWNADHPENTTLPMNTVDWDGSEFEPDLIFVNVGTNDAFYIRGISKDQQEEEQINFSNAYKDFIAQIRSVHPNAEILCTLGMMGQFLYEEIENAVDAYVKETKDDKVRAFPLSEENLELNGPGFSGHPSIFSHVFAANEAIEKIEELYGWKSDPNVDISEKVNSNPNGNN